MSRILFTTLLVAGSMISFAQPKMNTNPPLGEILIPYEKILHIPVAASFVDIKVQQYGNTDSIVFINLHDDESTSVDAARKMLEIYGGLLIEIENRHQRNISFKLGNKTYRVDPNRIFSKEGISKSMMTFGNTSPQAMDAVEKLGITILGLIPETAACIVALHNNTPDKFTVLEYYPGHPRDKETRKIFINPAEDPDDFFLTTDFQLYEYLSGKGYNTILQDNSHCTEDGSLSVYYGKKNKRYLNCETEHGKSRQYLAMMEALFPEIFHQSGNPITDPGK